MAKPTKKELLAVSGVLVIGVIAWWLLHRSSTASASGASPDTYYLTSNIPPLDTSGYSAPVFPASGSGSGACGCTSSNWVTAQQVAAQSGNNTALAQAISSLPDYLAVQLQMNSGAVS